MTAESAGGASPRRLPAEPGLWVFVIGDLLAFTLLFCVYLYYRQADPGVFSASQVYLNRAYGGINTLILLTSSWFVAAGIHKVRQGDGAAASRLFTATIACGVAFATIKLIEYGEKIIDGHTVFENDFFLYFFILTGIHFMHLNVGVGALFYMRHRTRSADAGAGSLPLLEAGAIYWHLVDLLWIVIFPLIYLLK